MPQHLKTPPVAHPPHLSMLTASLMGGMVGRSPLFGHGPLLYPDEEGAPAGEPQLTRTQWIAQETAEQAKKSVDQLAKDNAGLQWDLNTARSRFDPATQVAVSKEDAAALASYREQFPTPKDAKDAKAKQADLEEKDQLRSYDEARAAALGEYADLPDAYKALIPTAEELKGRPGGEALLRDLDHMKAEVTRLATAHGSVKQATAETTDVGTSPAEVRGGTQQGGNEGKSAATGYYARQFPQSKKEG